MAAADVPEKGDKEGDVEMAEATEEQNTASPETSPTTVMNPSAVVAQTDALLAKLRALKDNLSNLHAEEQKATQASKARLKHLQQLWEFNNLDDVRYERWSRTRLARLEVDYLLREGHVKTAEMLSDEHGLGELVDIDAFVDAGKVAQSLKQKDVEMALRWCKEHAQQLKKVREAHKDELSAETTSNLMDYLRKSRNQTSDEFLETALTLMKYHGLEHELRLQQCVEMAARSHQMLRELDEDADEFPEKSERYRAQVQQCLAHARKHLTQDVVTLGLVSVLAMMPYEESDAVKLFYAVGDHIPLRRSPMYR